MASDSIDIPSKSFHHFDGFMQDHPNIVATEAIVELQRLLRDANGVITSRSGTLDPKRLFSLDTVTHQPTGLVSFV